MKKLVPYIIVLASGCIGLLHFVTPGHDMFLHDTWRRLSYFPIALGALLYGLKGGLWMALLNSIAFIPHLLLFIGKNPSTYRSELTEVILYFATGALVGTLAGREKRLSKKYQAVSLELESTLSRLKEEAKTLFKLEEQLRMSQKRAVACELSTSLAHEIKNPLGAIRGAAEIIEDETKGSGQSSRFAGILIKETERLDRTLSGMLSMASEGGDAEDELAPLKQVVNHVVDTMEIRTVSREISLLLFCNADAGTMRISGEKVSQVLVNLILNAVEAVGSGGTIEVRAECVDAEVRVSVADNGPGIPEDLASRLFEPFVSGREGGSGLGLSISKRIAEGLGGHLAVTPRPGGGTVFTLGLPYSET
ncbi:MAG: ATP-binding protein [Desulfobacterales bacterium]|nr:ATP-binding protein [Desulfobacterales bacterium]